MKSNGFSPPVIAVDLGGTKIAAGVVSGDLEILARENSCTCADGGVDAVVARVVGICRSMVERQGMNISQVGGVSIAACGAIEPERGLVVFSPNLPGWCNVPLRDMVAERLGIGAMLINDANAAALGELRAGAGVGKKELIYLTLGTGIGGAIIIGGRLYTGSTGSAGELGHMTINTGGRRCNCGNTGCLETLASGTAIARDAIDRIAGGALSSLTEMVGGRLENIDAEKVAIAARAGDPVALDVINRAAFYLGLGMVNLVNIFNPEMIVVGGGVAGMGEILLGPAREAVAERAFPVSAESVSVVASQLGSGAGIMGAAIFALQKMATGEKAV